MTSNDTQTEHKPQVTSTAIYRTLCVAGFKNGKTMLQIWLLTKHEARFVESIVVLLCAVSLWSKEKKIPVKEANIQLSCHAWSITGLLYGQR